MWQGAVTSAAAVIKAKVPAGAHARLLVRDEKANVLIFTPEPSALDYSHIVTFRVQGLKAATTYTYRLEVNGRLATYAPGRLRTFPEEGLPHRVRFAFSSCARTGSAARVFRTIRDKQPDFFLHLGDFHYEDIGRNHPRMFRAAWDTVLSSPSQGPLYRDIPLAYVWDDHDFGPNDADYRAPAAIAARSVFQEYSPHYPFGAANTICQAFSVARARVILTDLRSRRSPNRAVDGPEKTMLGLEQKSWLKQELVRASRTHAVVFWGSSVAWLGDRDADAWAAYNRERRELADFIAAEGIRNLCILCGDAHMMAADDGSSSSFASRKAAPIPVLHGSSLDQGGSYKGGPYSHGFHLPESGEGCFGWVEVEDDGKRVAVDFTGRNDADEIKVSLQFEVT